MTEDRLYPTTATARYMMKFRHIMPMLVYIALGTVVLISLLHWISLTLNVNVNEEVWKLWVPLVFPWIPITIWLRPKLRVLVSKDSDRTRVGFQALAWLVIGVPCLIAQLFMISATGTLLTVRNVEEMRTHAPERYYAIRDFDVDSLWMALGEDIRTSGRYNEHLNIHFYFVVPIISASSGVDTTGSNMYWYGVKYQHQVSNRDSEAEKEAKYNAFYREDLANIRVYDFHNVTYFERSLPSDDLNGFLKGVERISPSLKEKAIILEPVNKPFEARTGTKLPWIFGTMAIGFSLFALFLTFVRYDAIELDNQLQNKKSTKKDDVVEMFKYLIPKNPHFVTSIILDINILIMIVMLFSGVHPLSPNGIELMEWGATRRAEVLDGQWWRLITGMFVHAGVVHLLLNIYGLVMGAMFLEKVLKPARYAIVYMLSGLLAGVATIFWSDNPAVGASGAIFGLFGANVAMLLTDHYDRASRRLIWIVLGPYVGLNLLMGFFIPGVGNAAHIGGLISGFLIGWIFLKTMQPSASIEPEEEENEPLEISGS